MEPLKTHTIAEIEGPGIIQHIFLTIDEKYFRDIILRIYWDDEEQPSVEVPLGEFFACGFGQYYKVNSIPIAVNPHGGLNSYWPMPFNKKAKITIENKKDEYIWALFYQVTYSLEKVSPQSGYFHAQYRKSTTPKEFPEHIIVDGIKGKGHYVGTSIFWEQYYDGWWGEGEVKFYMDGDKEHPTICGTGTEDYVGGAWCFGDTYSTAFLGYPFVKREEGKPTKHGMYRWHIMDPIRFQKDLRVTIQALGWSPEGYQPLAEDITTVAYWYQIEPHAAFPKLP